MTVQEKSHTWIYVVVIVAVLALMVAGVALYDHGKNTREARAKAQEFISKMEAAGYNAPSEAEVVSLFGADGGAAAKNPNAALLKWQYVSQLGTQLRHQARRLGLEVVGRHRPLPSVIVRS